MQNKTLQRGWSLSEEMDGQKQLKQNVPRGFLDESKLSKKERAQLIEKVVERLTCADSDKVADSNRTGAAKEMGIMNSFAWRGW